MFVLLSFFKTGVDYIFFNAFEPVQTILISYVLSVVVGVLFLSAQKKKKQRALARSHALLFVFIFLSALFAYFPAPEFVPTRWGLSGSVGLMQKELGLFFIPTLALGLYILFRALPVIAVFQNAFKKFRAYYHQFLTTTLAFLFALNSALIFSAFSPDSAIAPLIVLATGLYVMYVAYITRFIGRNYLFGFRTPWALAHDTVWARTQKVGSNLLMFSAALLIVSLLNQITIPVFIFAIIMSIAVTFVYSYLVYLAVVKKRRVLSFIR